MRKFVCRIDAVWNFHSENTLFMYPIYALHLSFSCILSLPAALLRRSGSHLDNFRVNTAIYRQRYLLAKEEACSHHCRIKFELINFRIKANVGYIIDLDCGRVQILHCVFYLNAENKS